MKQQCIQFNYDLRTQLPQFVKKLIQEGNTIISITPTVYFKLHNGGLQVREAIIIIKN